ncbi:DUF5615 family PIN-like protein [Limnospira indica]|uniref:DUF5615 domain-containing protein n=3 Tax=Limnospira TaxID=2596745 RepID=A0A9P1P2M7_9CYAN|nr:DUF5615 family PIN-like protein [Limnospira indica]UWU46451.1 hypothetical protein APLC1_1162 [Arthrospira platensis C1]CDM97752.1 conserved protein of unknown function [Limnospira indica PCC 8005]
MKTYSLFTSRLIHCPHPKSLSLCGRGTLRGDQMISEQAVPPLYQEQILRRTRDLTVWMVGDPGIPPRGTQDPEILLWCELNKFVLVTNNRRSMPVHLAEHLT